MKPGDFWWRSGGSSLSPEVWKGEKDPRKVVEAIQW